MNNAADKKTTNFPPARILELTKLNIQKEVMELEKELEVLNSRDVLTDYDRKLRGYIFNRCNKLWGKIARSPHVQFVDSFTDGQIPPSLK